MQTIKDSSTFDVIIIGAGISGSFIADELCQAGVNVLMLEAGGFFDKSTYPRHEIDGNARLYWSGGLELNTAADLALLRPKVVGGGSIVNQALLDRFDDIALDSWRDVSGVRDFSVESLSSWYSKAEAKLDIQEIPETFANGNARIFKSGFEKNGYQWATLRRAQSDCHYEKGNDCIECLSGCRIDSKQSMPITVLKTALQQGLTLIPQCEVTQIEHRVEGVRVFACNQHGEKKIFKAKYVVLAAGAIGNSKLLLHSGFAKSHPAIGENFYIHPQSMVLGIYDHEINAHKGPLQTYKSNDPNFRKQRFKLENVFAPPIAISMLIRGFGKQHLQTMRQLTHMACIEVAVRDQCPGKIKIDRQGRVKILKTLNAEDREARAAGLEAIQKIFSETGAKETMVGDFTFGLHLMGGLSMGIDAKNSVIDPEFRLHGIKNIYAADSSIFPNAPGINPSLTIMALSLQASASVIKNFS